MFTFVMFCVVFVNVSVLRCHGLGNTRSSSLFQCDYCRQQTTLEEFTLSDLPCTSQGALWALGGHNWEELTVKLPVFPGSKAQGNEIPFQ